MNILITGATRGIGKAIADVNIKMGNQIFASGRNEELLKCYDNYCICDLATIEGMQKLGEYIEQNKIDVVINNAGEYIYSASKAGLIGLTKAVALEVAANNITINTINPGWVDTDLGNESIDSSEFSKNEIVECIPQRRFVEPSEIVGMINYLISEQAKGVTGQSINLCAGMTVGY